MTGYIPRWLTRPQTVTQPSRPILTQQCTAGTRTITRDLLITSPTPYTTTPPSPLTVDGTPERSCLAFHTMKHTTSMWSVLFYSPAGLGEGELKPGGRKGDRQSLHPLTYVARLCDTKIDNEFAGIIKRPGGVAVGVAIAQSVTITHSHVTQWRTDYSNTTQRNK